MSGSTVARRRQITALVLSGLFAIVFFSLVLNGGMCERYQRKMERQELMRNYIDSLRSEEQRKKLTD